MKTEVIPSGEARFCVEGDVNVVLNGDVDPQHTPQLPLNRLPYALGAGRFSDPAFFGETIVLNQIAWGSIPSSKGELTTEKARRVLDTPFLLGMQIDKAPSVLVSYENLSAVELFEELLPRFELGYAFIADAVFGVFEGAYLKKSPIYHVNVNVHHEEYWQRGEALENVQGFLFGVVLTDKGKKTFPNYSRAFYQNPNESTPLPFSSHTHAALCEAHPLPTTFPALEQLLLSTSITTVRHFLTQSLLKRSTLALFSLHP